MVKLPNFDEHGIKKGAWSEDEDKKLRAYIERYRHWNWRLLPKFAGLSRSGKCCRLRWMNYLRPNVKHRNFIKQEDDLIIDLHNKLGNKWSAIAAKLPGRSDNEIKNHWNTHLKKLVEDDQTVSGSEHIGTLEPDLADPKGNLVAKEADLELQQEVDILLAGFSSESPSPSSSTRLLSCWLSVTDGAVSSYVTPQTLGNEMVCNIWTEPCPPDNDSIIPSGDNLLSPFHFVNDFISQSSCQNMMMNNEFLWSTLYTYVENNMEFITLKKRVQDDKTVSGREQVGTLEPDQANPKVNPVIKDIDLELQQKVDILLAGVSSKSPSSSSSTGLLSCSLSATDVALSSDLTPQTFGDEMISDFWTEPFLPDNESIMPSGDNFLSHFNFVNDFISQSSCQDMMMTDEFLW